MLVLTRKLNERIILEGTGAGAERIVIMIANIDGDRVKVGVEAPRSIRIYREELAHPRRCHECGSVSSYIDSVAPECVCRECGSQGTRRIKASPEEVATT